MRNKTVVEVDEAEETLEILDGGGLRIVSDGLDMGGKGVTPAAETWWPRKSTDAWAKEHFLGLTRIPLAARMERI